MRARSIKSTRHLFISWALLFISYYSWEDGLNCFSNGIWISYPPTCFVCLIKYLVLSFLIIIRQSKSKKETPREENIQMKFKTSIFETYNWKHAYLISPSVISVYLALCTPNRKHIKEPEAPPPHRYLRISHKGHTKKIVIKNSVLSDLYTVWINKKKVRNVRKQIVQ